MDVDVLLWSGGVCRFEAWELEGKFFVNPGSATGAVGMGWGWDEGEAVEKGTPSFCLMDVRSLSLSVAPPLSALYTNHQSRSAPRRKDTAQSNSNLNILTPIFQVQGDVLVLYVYQLKTDANGTDNVAVEKVSFRKQASLPA